MKMEKFVRQHTSEEVYKHCVATAEMAADLAKHHGLDSQKARDAGLLHDVARSLDDAALIREAERLGVEPSDIEKDNPILLHAKVAARMAQDEIGLTDPEILEAIAAHTTGAQGMGKLAHVVFVADYAEPTRDMPGVEGVRALLPDHLDEAVLLVLKNKMDYVKHLGRIAAPDSIQMWNELGQKMPGGGQTHMTTKCETNSPDVRQRKRKWGRVTTLLIVVVVAGLLASVSLLKARGGPPNIIIILIDTLRQDDLSLYGCPHPTSPFIDNLGRQGTVFRRVTAQSSYTAPSVASFLTSMYPSCHGAWGFAVILPESLTTLTEIFQDKGYRTGYFSAHWGLNEKTRYGQGADHFEIIDEGVRKSVFPETKDAPPLWARAEKVNDAVFKWLAEPDSRPTFLFVHYMDVHSDYDPPSPYREMFARNSSTSMPPEKETLLWFATKRQLGLPVEDHEVEHMHNLYRGEIAYVDSQIKTLVDELKRHKRYRNSWTIIWSDHGEEFYEHKRFSHGHTLYGELISVPLVITEPGWRKRHRVVDSPVELIDVGPTLCDLLGFDIPSHFQGRSFAGVFRNRHYVERESCYSELRPRRAPDELRTTITDRHKIICRSPTSDAPIDRIELYDIIADPGELHDLSESPAVQQTLASLLEATESIGCDSAGQDRMVPILDEELRERLRAVGYL